jgi:hypothetical protein
MISRKKIRSFKLEILARRLASASGLIEKVPDGKTDTDKKVPDFSGRQEL